jgi:hypothetical protein
MLRTRMNTAPFYHSRSAGVARLQSKMRNGMEEVVGSIPTRSTKFPSISLLHCVDDAVHGLFSAVA